MSGAQPQGAEQWRRLVARREAVHEVASILSDVRGALGRLQDLDGWRLEALSVEERAHARRVARVGGKAADDLEGLLYWMERQGPAG